MIVWAIRFCSKHESSAPCSYETTTTKLSRYGCDEERKTSEEEIPEEVTSRERTKLFCPSDIAISKKRSIGLSSSWRRKLLFSSVLDQKHVKTR